MKKLLLVLTVMATIASCGKNNKVDSNVAAVAPATGTVSNALAASQAPALVSAIANPAQFGQGAVITGGSSTSGQTCGTKFYIFNYCYSSSTSGSSGGYTSSGQTWAQLVTANPSVVYKYATGRTVVNSQVDIATKQAELRNILNSATKIDVAGPIYYITAGTTIYVIDTRYTIQMQPSSLATVNANGQVQVTDYFLQTI